MSNETEFLEKLSEALMKEVKKIDPNGLDGKTGGNKFEVNLTFQLQIPGAPSLCEAGEGCIIIAGVCHCIKIRE